jgi:hypothetical protein
MNIQSEMQAGILKNRINGEARRRWELVPMLLRFKGFRVQHSIGLTE